MMVGLIRGPVCPVVCPSSPTDLQATVFTTMTARLLAGAVKVCRGLVYGGYGIAQLTLVVRVSH